MGTKVNVGVIGIGTVGTGVVRALLDKAPLLERRTGVRVALVRACDRRPPSPKRLKLPPGIFTSDAQRVLRDPSIHIVVELIGGIQPAKSFILEAMRRGKHVVTANKALLAQEGHELFAAADRYRAHLCFEASVGGGIPIIKSLREGLIANDLHAIIGIINGTSNYILTQMRDKQQSFHEALSEAKKHGYAERNPSLDVDGHDAAHKLAILALLGFGVDAPMSAIHTEGISRVSLADIQYADQLGYRIKPLAIAKQVDGELELRVHPTLLDKTHPLANVNGVYNAIYVHGDLVGAELFYGRGAGQNPTASAVLADVADIAQGLSQGLLRRGVGYLPKSRELPLRAMDDVETRYYMRFLVIDKPGVLGMIAGVLGRHHISIASVSQKERRTARSSPVVMLTHDAKEANVRRALAVIDRLGVVKAPTVALRTEEPRGQ